MYPRRIVYSVVPVKYINGHRELHREDGPVVEYAGEDRYWCVDGLLHRENGPAVERANGDRYWYVNGILHREDGPAVERANGDRVWYVNDKLHREDGPAVERANGKREWHINGSRVCNPLRFGIGIEFIDDTYECPICYECTDQPLIKVKCNHVFHKRCVSTWFTRSRSCPLCRTRL